MTTGKIDKLFRKICSQIMFNFISFKSFKVQWQWDQECDAAIDEAKAALVSSKLLVHYDPKLPLYFACDACRLWYW